MARPVSMIDLTAEEKAELQRRVRSSTTPQRDARRVRIALLRADGRSEAEVAAATGVSINTVSLWSRRFAFGGLDGLADAAGRGRQPSLPEDKVHQGGGDRHAGQVAVSLCQIWQIRPPSAPPPR